ncbi:MAG: DUF4112 domain-containing protein [Gemmataceae bacterium]
MTPNPPVITDTDPPPKGEFVPRELAQIRALAKLLDSLYTVPGTNFKIGLDAAIGLVPVVGDLVGAVIGSYILTTAAQAGVPKPVLARMLLNIGTDAVAGAVPLAGDVLDAAWRANLKNARLLEQALAEPERTRRSSWWVIAGLVLLIVLIVGAGIALTAWLASLFVRWFS